MCNIFTPFVTPQLTGAAATSYFFIEASSHRQTSYYRRIDKPVIIITSMPQSDANLFYSSLSTRRATYPTWVLLTRSSIPTLIKRSDVGNEVCQVLLSSHSALPVPPLVNDIAESLSWLLTEGPNPFVHCHAIIAKCLLRVCRHQIHPAQAHFKITLAAMSFLMKFFAPIVHDDAIEALRSYLQDRWGESISFVGFRYLLFDSYRFLCNNFQFR